VKADRDRSIERLLRHAPPPEPRPKEGECPDAETLAALADHTLAPVARADVEAHVAECLRCQTMTAAMARMGSAEDRSADDRATAAWWKSRRVLGWLAPAAAAALALAIWVTVPGERQLQLAEAPGEPPPPSLSAESAAPAVDAPQRPSDDRAAAREGGATVPNRGRDTRAAAPGEAPGTPMAPPPPSGALGKADQNELARRESAAPQAERSRAQESSSTLSAAAGVVAGGRMAGFEIVSPEPMIRWRVNPGPIVEHSADGGATWTAQQTGATGELTAGSAPSPAVCWLVGRGGLVLRTTDGGRRWQQLPFPETVDLIAVSASSGLDASAQAADGRHLATTDGGQAWIPVRR
jgi:hypothetical protein